MKKMFYFIKNNALNISLIFCTIVLIALFCTSWILWKDTSIRALTAIALIGAQFTLGSFLPTLSKKELFENYSKTFIICCLAILVTIWGASLITKIDYCFLFLVASAILVAGISLAGILIISGIEILNTHKKVINSIFFPH